MLFKEKNRTTLTCLHEDTHTYNEIIINRIT